MTVCNPVENVRCLNAGLVYFYACELLVPQELSSYPKVRGATL